MAQQAERSRSSHLVDYPSRKQPPPLSNLNPYNRGSSSPRDRWSAPPTPTSGNAYEDYDLRRYHAKKTMLLKVKEKAKKWKQFLAKKKPAHQANDNILTPTWGVGSNDDHHGATMYKTEMASDTRVDSASSSHSTIQHPTAQDKSTIFTHRLSNASKEPEVVQVQAEEVHKQQQQTAMEFGAVKGVSIPETTVIPAAATLNKAEMSNNESTSSSSSMDQNPLKDSSSNDNNNKALSETVKEMLAPTYTVVIAIAAKIRESSRALYEIAAKQVWDKGVSIKQYLMQKLEPGEEDRALREVIAELVKPRIVSHTGLPHYDQEIVAKTREDAVSSSMGKELEIEGSPIPVSTNPHQSI